MTADESRLAGWYHSPCTIGPDPKPIRTGATRLSLAITRGKLQFYKLYARCYGGKDDGNHDDAPAYAMPSADCSVIIVG